MSDKRNDSVYIKVHKALCLQQESKIESRPVYNIMTLPKGTVVGEMDLSGCKINPKIMFEDKFNPQMYCAVYNREFLKNGNIEVWTGRSGGRSSYIQVDADALKDAVDTANQEYLSRTKKHGERVAEKTEEMKLQPVTPEDLKRKEEEAEV